MESFPHELKLSLVAGSHYEIGTQLGQKAKTEYGPRYIDHFLNAMTHDRDSIYRLFGMRSELTSDYIDAVFPQTTRVLQRVHPGMLEEMQGFADGLDEDYKRVVAFVNNFGRLSGCSQFFLNGHFARNYDDKPTAVENEFLLTQPTGSLKSFGAATSNIQRLDGINEAGLVVSLTFGAGYPPVNHGIGSAMFTRIVLDKAKTVDDVLELLEQAPYVTQNNVMVADANGEAVVIEGSAGIHKIRRQSSGILICANSYLHPEMQQQQKGRNTTTKWREQQMVETQDDLSTRESMMDFLTTDFPNGLFEPYYSYGLGTLWSVIYTPSNGDIYLATGQKGSNRREVKLNLHNQNLASQLPMKLTTQLKDVEINPRIPYYSKSVS
jgi:predicted choloylglycine hydrolase